MARRITDCAGADPFRTFDCGSSRGIKPRSELAELVQDYISNFRGGHNASLAFFKEQPTLADAIEKGALAIRADGKRQSHQRRLRAIVLRRVRDRLLARIRDIAEASTFERLLTIIKESAKAGFGPLAQYDTALRIGSRLGVLPDRVHLHAGTKKGARALGLDVSAGWLTEEQLPSAMRRLEPHEAEDFLCVYKDRLPHAGGSIAAAEAT